MCWNVVVLRTHVTTVACMPFIPSNIHDFLVVANSLYNFAVYCLKILLFMIAPINTCANNAHGSTVEIEMLTNVERLTLFSQLSSQVHP